MRFKRLIIATIAVFLSLEAMDFVVHNIILMSTYESLSHLWRPDMGSKMWIFVLATLVTSFLFVYIFSKGYENKGVMEGVRFGIVAGLFMTVMGNCGSYVYLPIPLSLAVKWFVFGMVEFIICGAVAALIYKKKGNAS
jgi:hypothetical protein